MAKSLSRIMEQIDRLQQEAAAIQGEVISRMRKEIARYGLTVEQLFGDPPKPKRARSSARRTQANPREAKYGDENGNVWGGVGKRPEWLRQALNSGRLLEEFLLVKRRAPSATSKRSRKPTSTTSTLPIRSSARKQPALKATAKKRVASKGADAA